MNYYFGYPWDTAASVQVPFGVHLELYDSAHWDTLMMTIDGWKYNTAFD